MAKLVYGATDHTVNLHQLVMWFVPEGRLPSVPVVGGNKIP